MANCEHLRMIDLAALALEVRLSVSVLSDRCAVPIKELRQFFRKQLHTLPKRWMLNVFAEKVEAMQQEGIPLFKIAESLGFHDVGHFSRTYSTVRGFPPSDVASHGSSQAKPAKTPKPSNRSSAGTMPLPGKQNYRIALPKRNPTLAPLDQALEGVREYDRLRIPSRRCSEPQFLASIAPDLLAVDGDKPPQALLAGITQLRGALPSLRLLIVTKSNAVQLIDSVLDAGVHGYVIQPASAAQYVAAIKMALPRPKKFPTLTPRETAVLSGLGQGLSYKEIAADLGISYSSVHKYQHAVYAKLGISNRSEATLKWLAFANH